MTKDLIHQIHNSFLDSKGVTTDSREDVQNKLFFALRGDTFNGNKFVSDAIEKGAKQVIFDDPAYDPQHDRGCLVENSLATLQRLAAYHRSHFSMPVIAIAGSNGKTTTKELIIDVLATRWRVHGTKGNFNNHIGLPLTLLDTPAQAEMLVVEMGARKTGDIEELCNIGQPTHGLITNAGKDHLETFGSVQSVIKTNAELYGYLATNGGTAFVNSDHAYLVDESAAIANRIFYGTTSSNQCYGQLMQSFPYLTIRYKCHANHSEVSSQLAGHYNVENILAALTVGHHFGVAPSLMNEAISRYKPSNNRSQIIQQNSNTIILDAYNANPTSMKEAIDYFRKIPAERKVAVLGDMLELGEASEQEHTEIIRNVKASGFDEVILVGEEFGKVSHHLNCRHFDSHQELKTWLQEHPYHNTTLLVKGSRGIALEKAFLQDPKSEGLKIKPQ